MNSFFKEVISHLIKNAFEGHTKFSVADNTAIGDNPVRSISLDAVPVNDEVLVSLAWDGGEKLFEKKLSEQEASHQFDLISTDLAEVASLTKKGEYDSAKDLMKKLAQKYTENTGEIVPTNMPKLNTTQAAKKHLCETCENESCDVWGCSGHDEKTGVDCGCTKCSNQHKNMWKQAKVTMQNLFFSSTDELLDFQKKMKELQPSSTNQDNIPLWEQNKQAPKAKDELAPPSMSYEDLEEQKEKEHENMEKHIDETIKTELESALQEKAASVFGPADVELVKSLRAPGIGRNWDEIKKIFIKDLNRDKDSTTIFLDEQRKLSGDEGVEVKVEEEKPETLTPPTDLVSPETHEKLLQDIEEKKNKKPVEEVKEKEIEKVEPPIEEKSSKKCPKCGEDIWDVSGGGFTGAKLNKCWNCGTAFDDPEVESNFTPQDIMAISELDEIARADNTEIRKVALKLWKSAPNYMGDDLSDYYVGPGKGYDADSLAKSNFNVALEMLGGEGKGVLVGSFGGFGGSFEQIFVHKDATDKVAILQNIESKLTDYPILDENDYYRQQNEDYEDSYNTWAKDNALEIIEEHLRAQNPELRDSIKDIPLTPEVESDLRSAVIDTLAYDGGDSVNAEELLKNEFIGEVINYFREKLGMGVDQKYVKEDPRQMKLFESNLKKKFIKNALKKKAADDLNPLQEPIEEKPTLPTQDVVPMEKSLDHNAPQKGDRVFVSSDLNNEKAGFEATFISTYKSKGTDFSIVETDDGDLLDVESHRVVKTSEGAGAQVAEPVMEPKIEAPTEEPIQVTPSTEKLTSMSSVKESSKCSDTSGTDHVGPLVEHQHGGKSTMYCDKHLPSHIKYNTPEPKESSQDEFLSIKAEVEALLKDVEDMGKTSYLFVKKGLEKHANDSAYEGNGWCRVWVQEDEVATSSKYAEILKLPDESARIQALKDVAREIAHESLRLADSAASKVGVQAWFQSLNPSDHDRIDWVALANPQIAESSLETKADVMDTPCEDCGKPLGPEVFLSKYPVCGKCIEKRRKKITGSDFEKGISQNKTSQLPAYKVTYEDGNTIITNMAAGITLEQAKEYFIGKSFNFGDTEEHPKDKMVRAISVEKVASQNKTSEEDEVGMIMAYEDGSLPEADVLKLFSLLVKNGHAWSLQGSYGRAAKSLIDAGWLDEKGNILKELGTEASKYSFSILKTADPIPGVDPKTQFKDYKITPKYVQKDQAVPATPEMDSVLSKMDELEQKLGVLDRAKKEIQAKMKEEMVKIDQSGERAQLEAEMQSAIEKAGILIEATESKIVSWRDKLLTLQNEEVQLVPQLTQTELLEKIYKKFDQAEAFVTSVLNGMLALAKTVNVRTLVRWPNKKSSVTKEASALDEMNKINDELLAALKELSSPL